MSHMCPAFEGGACPHSRPLQSLGLLSFDFFLDSHLLLELEEPAEGGETLELWLQNEYFVEFCLLSQSFAGLPCYVVAIEKNIGSCAIKKIIQEKTFPRFSFFFLGLKEQTANC